MRKCDNMGALGGILSVATFHHGLLIVEGGQGKSVPVCIVFNVRSIRQYILQYSEGVSVDAAELCGCYCWRVQVGSISA